MQSCELAADDIDDVFTSGAYGPLVAALKSTEARSLDTAGGLRQCVAAGGLDGADDLAAVLHYRIDQWAERARPSRRARRDRSIVGLIPAPMGITDPDMLRGLAERAQAMEQRALTVLQRAVDTGAGWTKTLGAPPADPGRYIEWARHARLVAAFVDLYGASHLRSGAASTGTEAAHLRAAAAAAQAARRAAAAAEGSTVSVPDETVQTSNSRQEEVTL